MPRPAKQATRAAGLAGSSPAARPAGGEAACQPADPPARLRAGNSQVHPGAGPRARRPAACMDKPMTDAAAGAWPRGKCPISYRVQRRALCRHRMHRIHPLRQRMVFFTRVTMQSPDAQRSLSPLHEFMKRAARVL